MIQAKQKGVHNICRRELFLYFLFTCPPQADIETIRSNYNTGILELTKKTANLRSSGDKKLIEEVILE